MSRSVLLPVLALVAVACGFPPYDVPEVRTKLARAGYAVTVVAPDPALARLASRPGVTDVTCLRAERAGRVDVACFVQCTGSVRCSELEGEAGESYGVFSRGPSFFVHVRCGTAPGWVPGTPHHGIDCGPLRDAIHLSTQLGDTPVTTRTSQA